VLTLMHGRQRAVYIHVYLSGRLWFGVPELIRFKVKSRIDTVFQFLYVSKK